jgi:hypothetical protein
LFRARPAAEPLSRARVDEPMGGPDMEQHDDRERRIGAVILLGLAAFMLLALASFYFQQPPGHQLSSIRGNIASTTR